MSSLSTAALIGLVAITTITGLVLSPSFSRRHPSARRAVLKQLRVELILLISSIAVIVLSQVVWPQNRDLGRTLALLGIGLGMAFIVIGFLHTSVAMIRAFKKKANTTA